MKKIIVIVVYALSLLFAGCSNPPYQGHQRAGADEFIIDSYKIKQGKFSILEMEGKPLLTLSHTLLEEKKDTVQNGDVLHVILYHPTRHDIVQAVQMIGAQIGFKVSQGHVVLPDLDAIYIEGLTLEEAAKRIQNEYQKHIDDIEVFLSFKDRLKQRVELIGLVMCSSVLIDGKTRLFDVLAEARIPTDANLFKSYVIRDKELLAVDLNKLIKEGDMTQNIVMAGGDKIYIAEPSSSTVMMLGEVTQRGLVNVPSGSISLREALAKAGGIPFTGDRAYIQVIRGNILKPKIYTLNWKHIIQLPTESMLLMPGDIVYVAATPITEWNRFVSQLFPSFTAIDWFGKGLTGMIL